jgi:hypothetical protein
MSKEAREPAFPSTTAEWVDDPENGFKRLKDVHHYGMTLRDYFAAKAIIDADVSQEYAEKLLGRTMPNWMDDTAGNAEFWADFEAIARYIKADAMLKAREQQHEPTTDKP